MRAVALLLLFATAVASADEAPAIDPDAPSLRVLALKDGQPTLQPRVKVGEPFRLVVSVTPKADVVVGMPAAFDTGVFEVIDRHEGAELGSLERTFDLTVVAWEPGKQIFPPIPVTYVPKGQGQIAQIKTGELEIEVVPTLAGPGPGPNEKIELRPLAPPVPVYEKDWTLVIAAAAAGGAFVAAAAVLFAVRAVRRRRARVLAASPVVDLRPANEIALEKLRALATSPLLEEPDRRRFYFAMTEVVREYLGRRFGFGALDMTTSELLAALAGATDVLREDVAGWLGGCDLVKFARVPASREDATEMLAGAVALVERSRSVVEPSATESSLAR